MRWYFLGLGVATATWLIGIGLPMALRALAVRFAPPADDVPVGKIVYREGFKTFDPSKRERANKRREIADAAKARAAKIVSGESSASILRQVK